MTLHPFDRAFARTPVADFGPLCPRAGPDLPTRRAVRRGGGRWLAHQALRADVQRSADALLRQIDFHGDELAEVETEIAVEAIVDAVIARLMTVPRDQRHRRQVATVATARKMTVLCWHLVTKEEDCAFARPSLVAQQRPSLEPPVLSHGEGQLLDRLGTITSSSYATRRSRSFDSRDEIASRSELVYGVVPGHPRSRPTACPAGT